MATSPSASAEQTDQLAQNLPGFDPSAVIAQLEQGLLDSLGIPIQQLLGGLPLQQFPQRQDLGVGDLANQIDPLGLITPVVNVLGTLGPGQFPGVDPTQMLKGVSEAFDGTAIPMQQALGAVAQDWQGVSGEAADAKARGALTNGAAVAAQADGLSANLSVAASNVLQSRIRMLDIIDEYQATLAAVDVSTLAGRAAAVEAANHATTESAAVMNQLQDTLGTQASQASKIGAPVPVANVPDLGDLQFLSPLKPLAALDPTGVLDTVVSDPRVTTRSLAGNVMDLIFLPQTVTEMNQGIKDMNSTLKTTNGIMTGLNGTMNTVNGTMHTLNGTMQIVDGTMQTLNGSMHTVNGTMQNLDGRMQNVDGTMQNLDGRMQKVDGTMQNLDGRMQKVDGTMGETNQHLGDTKKEIEDLNDTIPGPVKDWTNIGDGADTPWVPW